ncbi:hypothetical protein [Hymenobacter pini]|uniref:hypothetical protein n=1 Tax=Hymenobacter pini TaxID=2880879 RepID=UPI001CF3773B|nr:hypothetical protein [Hymenobacter pini]MCA8831055.1 hypothetical protein [Hymenobacter pini]
MLFVPPVLFGLLLLVFQGNDKLGLTRELPYLPWQFLLMGIAGVVATAGGVLDWRYHRNPLNLKIPKKERDAEAAALGLGGVPMFGLMWLAMMHPRPAIWLIPILLVLIYTVVAISYDEFVFHIKRCGPLETTYHRMLVFGNGIAWLAWFHFIFCR